MNWNHPGAPNNFGGQFRQPGYGMQGRGGPMQRGNFRGHPNGFGFGNNGFARGGPNGPRMGFAPDNGFGNFNGPPMGQMCPPSKRKLFIVVIALSWKFNDFKPLISDKSYINSY